MATADTTTFLLLHRAMRTDSTRMAASVQWIEEREREDRGGALARWYSGFRSELLAHHQVEDEIFMPALIERAPALAIELARVDADHHHLDDVLEQVRVSLDRLADPMVPFPAAHAAALRSTGELRALLQHHLDFEDDIVVPLFPENFSAEEYEHLDVQARKSMRLSTLTFTLPWIMDNANALERQGLLEAAPLPFKFMWYATRGRYRRLAAAAFAGAPAVVAAETESVLATR